MGRQVMRSVAALGLVGAVGATTGCEPAPCSPPFVPAIASEQPGTEGWPVADIEWRSAPPMPLLDTDADGRADEVIEDQGPTGSLVVRRTSGDLVLTSSATAARVSVAPGGPAVGDIDGDHRSDIVVRVEAVSGGLGHYLVRGSTADGSHEVTAVGVLIAGWDPLSTAATPGDVDADGLDDLVLTGVGTRPDGSTFEDTLVHSGARLAAAPPGGPSDAPVALGARLVAPLALDETRSVLVVATSDTDSYDPTVWFAGATVALTTGGSGVFPPGAYWPIARLGDGPEGRVWLSLEAYGRAGNGGWAWDLTNLCTTTAG